MSFLFSFFVLPIVLVGLIVSAKNLYLYLLKHPQLKASDPNTAGLATFLFAGLSAGLIAAPHFLTGAVGLFHYVLAVVYVSFLVVGITRIWKWVRLVKAVEDGDPANDPTFPEDKAKPSTGNPGTPAAPASPDKK